jgi:hypothetical protein
MSLSKLQSCLELCRFIQALLKTKVVRWKLHFLLGICKKTIVQHSSERMAYYSRYATGKKGVALGVSGYNKSHPSPKLTASLRLMIGSLSSFVSNPCLTSLSIACISFTSSQRYSWVHVYHQALPLWLRECIHVSYPVLK